MARYTVRLGKRTAQADTHQQASEVYTDWREEYEARDTRIGTATVYDTHYGDPVATITPNGKVWQLGEWHPGKRPLWSPYGDGIHNR